MQGNTTYSAEYKAILMRTMKDFMSFCEHHGFTWYLAFGAAIGAVRHGGLIPWDDDIDVYMPRKDYEKFLEYQGNVDSRRLEGRYEILTYRTAYPELPVPFAKFSDLDTTIWEQERFPFVTGISIDVFPLDKAPDDSSTTHEFCKKMATTFRLYKRGLKKYSFKQWCKWIADKDFHQAGAAVEDVFILRFFKNRFKWKYEELEHKLAKQNGDFLIAYSSNQLGKCWAFPKEWFETYKEVPFDGITVRLPKGNDKILRKIYGDYMTPPPPEQRVSNHQTYFIDLKRRLSLDQARLTILER